MIKKIKSLSAAVFLILIFLGISSVTKAQQDENGFNPDFIIGDGEVLDYTSMTLEDIRSFLVSKGGYLAGYSCANPDGKMMTAAEIIYDRAIANKVNPKFILVLLQKEMSLIDDVSPKQTQLDWAAGYGCPDGAGCNVRWKGFWKQVNSATLQFRDYMDNPQLYTYKAGGNYVFTNRYSTLAQSSVRVIPQNQATAALYNYTPHVYNGNYNFWKIWNRWFTRSYLDGSIVQAKGDKDVWLIQDGKRRKFASNGVLMSRYNINKILTVDAKDLGNYEIGAPIKFAQYSLVQSPKGTIYLIVDDKKQGIASMAAFRKIGFSMDEVVKASWDDLAGYKEGPVLTATSSYPTGALLQDNKTGGVYWVINNAKAPVIDRIFLATKFKNRKIKAVKPEELDKYATMPPVLYDNGELLKSPLYSGVYVISDGEKRAFSSGELFEALGYRWSNIITVPEKIVNLYPTGKPVVDLRKAYDDTSASSTATSTTPNAEIPDGTSSSSALLAPTSTQLLSTTTVIAPFDYSHVPTGTIVNATSTN